MFVNVYPEIVVIIKDHMISKSTWVEIFNWCEDQGITATLMNQWIDQRGYCYSFRVYDEMHRIWFMLRWS